MLAIMNKSNNESFLNHRSSHRGRCRCSGYLGAVLVGKAIAVLRCIFAIAYKL
jgi:hypothetical protein